MDQDYDGIGIRVRAYFGERDHLHGKSLWSALLDFLRREGAAGANRRSGDRRIGRTQPYSRRNNCRPLV